MKYLNNVIIKRHIKGCTNNMKIYIIFMIVLAMSCSILTIESNAANKYNSGWGVRPLGMGGAFTAVANDSNAPLYNPAGLAAISKQEISFMSARLFTGLEGVDIGLNYLAYVYPVNNIAGNLGITWSALSSPGLYREDTANISYGRYINDIISINDTNISFGVNVKYYRNEYKLDMRTENDPVFSNGNIASAIAGDAAVLAELKNIGVSIGFASKNINSPNVGYKTNDVIYNENVLGLAYYNDKLPYLGLPCFTLAVDVVNRDKDTNYRAGVETWLFNNHFAIRAGGRSEDLTFGLGYEFEFAPGTILTLDYAFAWPLKMEQTTGSHRLGLTLRLP